MIPKTEVDYEFFTTCHLCLDKKGNNITKPDMQKNIKYDIEVELNNRLPQLICLICESVLSKCVCTKLWYQEKEKTIESISQSSQNVSLGNKNRVIDESKIIDIPTNNGTLDNDVDDKNVSINETVTINNKCKFCTKTYTKQRSINKHIQKHKMLNYYQNIGQEPNLTGSKKFVMFNANKIIQYRKKDYYNAYLQEKKLTCIASSDEDEWKFNPETSGDTVVIEQRGNQNETDVDSSTMRSPRKIKDFKSQLTTHEMQPGANIYNTSRLNYPVLLSSLECKNLDILNKNSQNDSKIVRIDTDLKGKQYLKNNSVQHLSNALNVDTNFLNILSDALNSETKNEEKSASTNVFAKLLNASPAAYPKQLTKKSIKCNNTVQGSSVNSDKNPGEQVKRNISSMVRQNDVAVECNVSSSTTANNIKEPSTYPRIQVKHIDKLK